MKVSRDEYEQFRAWLAIVWPYVSKGVPTSPETDPVLALDQIAAKSRSKARQGLSLAIGDIIEDTSRWATDAIVEVDQRLFQEDLPSLSDVRIRFSRTVQHILRRGRIENELEFHTVRNFVENDDTNEEELWRLLEIYENSPDARLRSAG